jgi:hypothetical protein
VGNFPPKRKRREILEQSLFGEMWQATRGKTVIRGGKKIRKRLYPISLDSTQGHLIMSQLVAEDTVESILFGRNELKNTSFLEWVTANYQDLLTKTQLRFIEDTINGNEQNYRTSARAHFSMRLQTRLKTRFLGDGAIDIPVHRLSEYRKQLDMLYVLVSAGENNDRFTKELMSRLDNDFIEGAIYEKCSKELLQHICLRFKSNTHKIPVRHLSAIYTIFVDELDRLHSLNLH